jgi:hypothetical protein
MSQQTKPSAGRNRSTQPSASSEMPAPAALVATSSDPRDDSEPGIYNPSVADRIAEANSYDVSEADTESDSEDEEEEDTAAMMPVDDNTPPNFRERVDLGHDPVDEAYDSAGTAAKVQSSQITRPGGSDIEDGSDSEMSSGEEQVDPAVQDSEDEEEETEDEDEDDDEEEEP